MSKNILIFTLISFIFVVSFIGCSEQTQTPTDVSSTLIDGELAPVSNISLIPLGELDNSEKEGLLYMIEEEKLARDVYITFYQKWGLKNFNNISSSEQTHVNAIKSLINKYSLSNPIDGKAIGKFVNQDLQKLYNMLIEDGSKSVVNALKVGALIEEVDIVDLKKYINETDKKDIKLVYTNLMEGSKNHLRSFVSVLTRYGVVYKPLRLTNEEYNQIIN
jgi:hypothetical protein